jgi:S-adenosylmethionine:tRNA ribosyltransferase-isomerase
VEAVERTRASGGRVVAAGTTVVRALEGSAALHAGRVSEGGGVTDLRLGPGFRPRVVDGLLTGIHEPGTSHYALLEAFVAPATLAAATRYAEEAGYLTHEFGDGMLVLARSES